MAHHETGPRTFVEMVLLLLEDRFPWLGSDQPVSGSDTVGQLSDLHQALLKQRSHVRTSAANSHPVTFFSNL